MKRNLLLALVLLASELACTPSSTLQVTESFPGESPVFSPDSSKVAFQRAHRGGLAVFERDLQTGAERVIAGDGKMLAGQPAYATDGRIVFVACSITNTAAQAKRFAPLDGCNVYCETNGQIRRLTEGRYFETTPFVSREGRLYWSVYGLSSGASAYDGIGYDRPIPALVSANIPATGLARPEILYVPTSRNGSVGVSQPALSPDGRLLAWAEVDSLRGVWHVCASRLDNPDDKVVITPAQMVAYAPRFAPDSQRIIFSGYQEGDKGWSVYLYDLATGMMRWLTDGCEPCLSRDGTRLACSREGVVYVKSLLKEQCQFDEESQSEIDFPQEEVRFRLKGPHSGTMPLNRAGGLTFGTEHPFFIRTRMRVVTADELRIAISVRYDGVASAVRVYLKNRAVVFSLRSGENRECPNPFPIRSPLPSEVTCVGIRMGDRSYVSVNGAPPQALLFTRDTLALNCPESITVGSGVKNEVFVRDVEIGTGWPSDVPLPTTGKDLLK